MELKIGQRIKAHWDGSISEIVEILGDIVVYKCLGYENRFSSDGLFRDTVETIKKEFILIDYTN